MAKTNQATQAKKNRRRFMQFWKRIKATAKRTVSGLRKAAKVAKKLPEKLDKAVKKWSDDVSKAVHSQNKCSPAAARKRMTERKVPVPKEKPCPVAAQRAKAIAANAKRITAENKRLAAQPQPNGNKLMIDSIRSGAADAVLDRSDRARAAVASVPAKITVPSHQRKGTKGVTQHGRKTTMKERNQVAAERVMRVFEAESNPGERQNSRTSCQWVGKDPWGKVEDISAHPTK